MSPAELVAGATFLLVVVLVLGPYLLLVVRPEAATQEMLRQRIRTGGAAVRPRATAAGLLKEVERLSVFRPLNTWLAGESRVAQNLRDVVQMSGTKMTPGQMLLGSACLALLGYVLSVMWIPRASFGLLIGGLFGAAPYGILAVLRARRLGKFEEQFPEAIDLIARTLRAGHAFSTGLRMASEELPQPVAAEFRLLYDQQNYGLPLNDGLRALARRVPLIDARFFVTAVLTQREAGGNLAEVLDNLSAVIRERFKIKRQLRVISAHGRLTGVVLTALPPALAVFLLVRMPDHFTILFDDPLGIRMIVVAVSLQILGAFLIYKITKVDY